MNVIYSNIFALPRSLLSVVGWLSHQCCLVSLGINDAASYVIMWKPILMPFLAQRKSENASAQRRATKIQATHLISYAGENLQKALAAPNIHKPQI